MGRSSRTARRVVYIVIDGMRTDAFEQAAHSGRAPALAFLKERASYVRDSVAVFPSITPCATASLITGETPDKHRIPGQSWYDRAEGRFINYGQGPRVSVVQKVREVASDLFVNLNRKHLGKDVRTLHETLDAMGLATASTNFLVYRGPHRHKVHPNALERILLDDAIPGGEVMGPRELYFADVIHGPTAACEDRLGVRGRIRRIKAADEWAACVTRELIERDAADMILFYLHENDHFSHREGPGTQVDNLVRASELIGHVLEALGSWERTVDEIGFVLTADHGQSAVIKDDDHFIDLDEVLDGFRLLDPKRGPDRFDDQDLAQCGNGRAGYIYLHPERAGELVRPVVDALLQHPGMDQVLWRDRDWRVVEGHRGRLRFRPADDGGLVDERGNRWEVQGDLEVVDGVVEDDEVRTPEYQVALWRIHAALGLDRVGDVCCTSKLTYETANVVDTDHKGEHGSLHAEDSHVPFLSTLADPPLHPSTVDVAPHIVRHFESLRG
ncbi:MAG: alkaline phosphatase family protein [Actinomycetota bacterium]